MLDRFATVIAGLGWLWFFAMAALSWFPWQKDDQIVGWLVFGVGVAGLAIGQAIKWIISGGDK